MNNAIRDCVLGMVAGMRGEKRAALDDDKPDNIAAQLGAVAAPHAAVSAYAGPVIRRHINASSGLVPEFIPGAADNAAAKVVESMKVNGVPIRRFLNDRGIDLYSSMQFKGPGVGPSFVPRAGGGSAILDAIGSKGGRGAVLLGFKPSASRSVIEGITAHELGHAARSSMGTFRPSLYSKSKLLTLLTGLVGSARTAGRDTSGREAAAWSAATALTSLPMLHEEIQASRLGSRLAGLRGLRRLRAFRGVPTYLATAAMPGLTYAARRAIDHIFGTSK